MPYRKFEASIFLKNGEIADSTWTNAGQLYPSTLMNFLQKIILKLVTNDCQNGELKVSSQKEKLLIVTSGDLKNCRTKIVEEIQKTFDFDVILNS